MANTDNTFTFLHPMIIIYPNLIEARPYMENGKPKGTPKFGAGFIINPVEQETEWKAFREHSIMIARAEWPSLDLKTELNPNNGWPWRSGTRLADVRKAKAAAKGKDEDVLGFLRGMALIRAGSGGDYPPRLCGFEPNHKGPVEYADEQRNANRNKFRPGMLVLAKVNVKTTIVTGNKYVVAYLNMVCSTGNMGPIQIAMQKSAAEVFSGYQGHATNEDPTGGQTFDDEIPF